MKLKEKVRSYTLTDFNTPVLGEFCKRFAELDTSPTKEIPELVSWWAQYDPSEQWPNQHEPWMEDYALQSLPHFDFNGFRTFLLKSTTTAELLECPPLSPLPVPTPHKTHDVAINNEQIIHAPKTAPEIIPTPDNGPTNQPTQLSTGSGHPDTGTHGNCETLKPTANAGGGVSTPNQPAANHKPADDTRPLPTPTPSPSKGNGASGKGDARSKKNKRKSPQRTPRPSKENSKDRQRTSSTPDVHDTHPRETDKPALDSDKRHGLHVDDPSHTQGIKDHGPGVDDKTASLAVPGSSERLQSTTTRDLKWRAKSETGTVHSSGDSSGTLETPSNPQDPPRVEKPKSGLSNPPTPKERRERRLAKSSQVVNK